ncbi:MAG: glycosyltransferase family A protein [Microbacterium gubbeenense]
MTPGKSPNHGADGTVDMVVAVHDTRRDIRRAISSILADPDSTIRAFVVAHNIERRAVENELADLIAAHPGRIRIEELMDAIPSPSGPFNFGMQESDAEFVGIMGSDDELDPGAIAQWRLNARKHDADAVIAKVVRGELRTLVRSPPKRLFRTGVLDFAKDRLSYRSAPLGLIKRSAIGRLDLKLLEGARNGGDLPFVTRLWLKGRVVPARGLAAYVEHADAPVRVTYVAKPVAEELSAVVAMLDDPLMGSMSISHKEALVTKLLRRNLTDSVRKRKQGRGFTPDDILAFQAIVRRLDDLAPRARRMLSVAQARMFTELMSVEPDLEQVAAHDAAALRFRSVNAIRPASLAVILHPQAQPRFMAASGLIKIGASRYFPAARLVALVGSAVVVAMTGAMVIRALARSTRH